MHWIVREYRKQVYASEMHNLEEMDQLLEWYNFPSMNQEEIGNMSKPITSTEIKTDKKSPQKQKPRASWLHSWIQPKI